MAESPTTSSSTSTITLLPTVSSVTAEPSGAQLNTSASHAASSKSRESTSSTSNKPKTDPWKGPGYRLAGPISSPVPSSSSQTSTSSPSIQIKSPEASQDTSSDPASADSEWRAARPGSSAPAIREHFKRGADVLRQLVEEKYRLSNASDTITESDSNWETLQKQEGNFSQAQISDAETLYKLSQESDDFGGKLKSVMKAGRKAKVDMYHQTIEDKDMFSAMLNGQKAYQNAGLQPTETEIVTDIMWRNPTPVLSLFGKLTTKPRDSTEQRSNTGTQQSTVQERLAPYTREGYHIGAAGYDEEAAQIRADIRADLSRPSTASTTDPRDLQSLSGHALVRGLAEIGTTILQNSDMDIGDLCSWGNTANSVYRKKQAAHRTENMMDQDEALGSEVESKLQHEVTEILAQYLRSQERSTKWYPDRIPRDVESLGLMWAVSDKNALDMAVRSIPRGLPSRSDLEKEKREFARAENSKLDDPDARWAEKR